ncbi:hypothetical protein EVAR_26798_1 [Eumeta japonica]|uniref:Uncharacterized protein n=1 Tax=Eumeta variegata TaxID=151549 RepID=A0A4C1WDX7_EUMVA|nr:hypothetical protein EVAR_26798_1 [Eumeta japonica]
MFDSFKRRTSVTSSQHVQSAKTSRYNQKPNCGTVSGRRATAAGRAGPAPPARRPRPLRPRRRYTQITPESSSSDEQENVTYQ